MMFEQEMNQDVKSSTHFVSVFLSDVEAFARAMQASKDPKEKKDDEDMSLD